MPIQTEIPIKQSFDTTIEVETPLGFSVPIDVTVPVDVVVPVDLIVEIPVNETVPIEIDVSQTEFATLTDSLAEGLESTASRARRASPHPTRLTVTVDSAGAEAASTSPATRSVAPWSRRK